MHTYKVWRVLRMEVPHIGNPTETKTNHTIRARTLKEAEYKLGRKFKNAGFHRMLLFVRKASQ